MTESVRLAKRLAELVPCSRREAELYIEGGWVRVDGRVIEEPQFRVLHQKIELDKNASLMAAPDVTLLLHKPPGYGDAHQLLTPAAHASDDPSGIAILKRHFTHL